MLLVGLLGNAVLGMARGVGERREAGEGAEFLEEQAFINHGWNKFIIESADHGSVEFEGGVLFLPADKDLPEFFVHLVDLPFFEKDVSLFQHLLPLLHLPRLLRFYL